MAVTTTRHSAVELEQGDSTPVDSKRGVSRQHIADALVQSVLHEQAVGLTFELFSGPGSARDLERWHLRVV